MFSELYISHLIPPLLILLKMYFLNSKIKLEDEKDLCGKVKDVLKMVALSFEILYPQNNI